jgi:hypothetical protein
VNAKIVTFFNDLPMRILRRSEVELILDDHREEWQLPATMSRDKFIEYLLDHKVFTQVRLAFPYRPEIRYVWGDVSVYELALSLSPNSYLSHYTAMFLHGLTEQSPKTVYVNSEQTEKPQSELELTQEGIDRAFKGKQRVTKKVAPYKKQTLCVLNGKQTGQLGVVDFQGADGKTLRVTGIERTLIDIVVRPYYSGGVFEVLKAYRNARESVSVNKLVATLTNMEYVYPYHQAIGFYLSRADYKEAQLDLLRGLPMRFDFYLSHQMKRDDADYSPEWRLFYPKGF